jgi:AcrR family transcriptional regulator
MTEGVKRRTYDASRRQQQARDARTRILAAAREHFLADGYAATTVAAIAIDAGVSVEAIYKAFKNKPGLLKALFDVAIAGDDEPVALMDRDFVGAINAQPDSSEKLRMYARHLATAMARTAPIQLLVRSVAAVDPAIAAVHDQMQRERLVGMTAFATHLAESGSLRDDISRSDARDILWTYTAVELYELLVDARRWSNARYRDFVADALIAALVAR